LISPNGMKAACNTPSVTFSSNPPVTAKSLQIGNPLNLQKFTDILLENAIRVSNGGDCCMDSCKIANMEKKQL
jgi:hypothetical protein